MRETLGPNARIAMALPWAVPEVIAVVIFAWIFDSSFGLMSWLLIKLGLADQMVAWVSTPGAAFWALSLTMIWKGFPFVSIMTLAGLQSIPDDFYAAAKVDGASALQRFRWITLPSLMGSLWTLILAHSTLIIPFTTWMLKGYFDTIPRELEQAAMVDGCSPLGAMWRVILPVSAPGLAATALYAFVLSWADYAYARTFLVNIQDNWTANLGIATMRGEYTTDWNEISAAAVFVAIPIMLVYLFLERYLVGGLTAGAEK